MTPLRHAASCFCVLVVLAGCASTEVSDRQRYEGAKLARPYQIIVYDFAATPAEVPADSAVASQAAGATPQTPEDIATGRKLGAEVAKYLVADLQGMGLPAVQAAGQPAPQVDDIEIRGSFVTIDEGSAAKRILLGFGAGAAELQTVVEGYQMTPQGLRRLGSGDVTSGGNEMPGMVVPLAVAAATANPIGLIVVGGVKIEQEASGSATIEGRAKATAEEIAAQLKTAAEKQGWI